MNALRALSVKSILMSSDRDPQPLIASLMACNCMTLRHLDLGAEIKVFINNGREYQDARPENSVASTLRAQIESEFKTSQQPVYFPNVDRMRLRGLNVPALFRGQGYKLIDFKILTNLTLESCNPTNTALEFLANVTLSRLRFVQVRSEWASGADFPRLETFLCGLVPLEGLSILMEGSVEPTSIRLGTFLRIHGQSLQTLLIDIRRRGLTIVQDRIRLWHPQCVRDICELCPNLVELGMPLAWNDLPGKFGRKTVGQEVISLICTWE